MRKFRDLGRVTACSLLIALAGIPASAAPQAAGPDSPVRQWAPGDWWEVQFEQLTVYSGTANVDWTPSFRLHFRVTAVDAKAARVEVTTVPPNRSQEHLELVYALNGDLTSAMVVDPERSEPLGPAGSPGVFGMLGREAFQLSKAPPPDNAAAASPQASTTARGPVKGTAGLPKASSSLLTRVRMDPEGRYAQLWERGGKFWTRFESAGGLPQRGTLMGGFWRRGTSAASSAGRTPGASRQ